jgi:hypothetical protein
MFSVAKDKLPCDGKAQQLGAISANLQLTRSIDQAITGYKATLTAVQGLEV